MLFGPYRVLDLTDEQGVYAGKLLADLGMDVVKVEPPCGDKTQYQPLFVGDRRGVEGRR